MIQSGERDSGLAALMRQTQGGSESAYHQLLTEVAPLLRRVVRSNRGFLQPQDVEDLVQDILLSLHAVRASYDPERPFLPWLMAIARNRMADGARRYSRRVANEVAVERYPEILSAADTNKLLDDYDDREMLGKALQRLPRGQREAVEMLKLRELSLKEASAESGLSIASLKVAVHRGIKSLRAILRDET
ncbi:RNA polymerase, sigma subunit, ECF family [Tistlia consotensis]|uniref:RNA polymerase, sigma subunit, ECF family n=1 Tax=Tistlia consotensis USBA 355 TaxID=560819 RepID=A0A1Y6CQV7_9PROT|nr:sigma-70 family RNA polymerase sigma factor [Tistlia consotensis]SMF84031.1 RNA polymerase, sigma subunit, ECF family [Tistlia consotensis USBA 355]SNS40049.1 RNA polymerase, sigma subunit, ECF family [Tistlia consotensis]